jgi:hypothetical protein
MLAKLLLIMQSPAKDVQNVY